MLQTMRTNIAVKEYDKLTAFYCSLHYKFTANCSGDRIIKKVHDSTKLSPKFLPDYFFGPTNTLYNKINWAHLRCLPFSSVRWTARWSRQWKGWEWKTTRRRWTVRSTSTWLLCSPYLAAVSPGNQSINQSGG